MSWDYLTVVTRNLTISGPESVGRENLDRETTVNEFNEYEAEWWELVSPQLTAARGVDATARCRRTVDSQLSYITAATTRLRVAPTAIPPIAARTATVAPAKTPKVSDVMAWPLTVFIS